MISGRAGSGHLGADTGPCPWKMISAGQFLGLLGCSLISSLQNKCSVFEQRRRVSKALLPPGSLLDLLAQKDFVVRLFSQSQLFSDSLSEEIIPWRRPLVPGWILVSSEVLFYFFNLPKISLFSFQKISLILHKYEHKFFPKSETIIFAFLFIFLKKINCKNLLSKKQVFDLKKNVKK